jgi:hypothetical protein
VTVTTGSVTYTTAQGVTTPINAGQTQTFSSGGGATAQFTQQGPKLFDPATSLNGDQGAAVALSADGNTAIVGGPFENPNPAGGSGTTGAAWIYTRTGTIWTQQVKLVATAVGPATQGGSVSLSADGNTAIVGGTGDSAGIGAAWVWIRSGSTWTQQAKLVGTGVPWQPKHRDGSCWYSW